MMDIEMLMAGRGNPSALAEGLTAADISFLVGLLEERNNDIRYAAFLTLQRRSGTHGDVYPFWDMLAGKLQSGNSYQRSIGVMLLSENVRWDREGRLDAILNDYVACFHDEKFITARQAIQSLEVWLPSKPEKYPQVLTALTGIPVEALPGTQGRLILMDILNILSLMQREHPRDEAAAYIFRMLDGSVFSKKERKAILQRMGVE